MRFKIVISIFLICILCISLLAQDICSEIVQTAIETALESCDGLRNNQACYGNIFINAEAAVDANSFIFETAGDKVDIVNLATMRMSSRVEETGEWGISLLNIQASLPNESSENVRLVLFGDVEIENQVTGDPVRLEVIANSGVNIRRRPVDGAIIGSLQRGQVAIAFGRNDDASWLHVEIPNTDDSGWVSASLVDGEDDSLPVLSLGESLLNPMQAFYFRSGYMDAPCEEVANSGLLIQTPDGAGRVTFRINEVTIELGSTAYLLTSGQHLYIYLLEGNALVEALDVVQALPAGTFTRIALNNNIANSSPEYPQAYQIDDMEYLPLSLLLSEIEVALPPSLDELDAAVVTANQEAVAANILVEGEFVPDEGLYTEVRNVSGNTFTFSILITDVVPGVSFLYDSQAGSGPNFDITFMRVAPNLYQMPGRPTFITLTSSRSMTMEEGEPGNIGYFTSVLSLN